ncbi:MAG TPA: hypothetical protein PKJ04_08320 [Nitrospira sp.]|nr:hypothetical protein [Nitrospira sp.]MBX3338453.1 hypothetical protein [Nitrospira sp.]MCW5795451.1 hypothetical protein [Nitrospira sp.]HNL88887.1 hypothetical protein [Nitrospira sp.]HUM39723.1 hypothetical protein [Nitrospira sp.]
MLENLDKEILNLAKDIAERGLSPIDGVLVLPNPESSSEYVVWEGNRRITALKLIDDPNRCPNPILRRKFADIAGKAKIQVPHLIECTIAPSIEEADRLIELRHQGPREGVGTLPWDGQQKSRHLQRLGKKGRYAFSHQIIDAFADKLEQELKEKVTGTGFAISTLDRLLKNPEVRDFLGITNEDGMPRRFLHEKETLKGLTRILGDIANGMPVKKVYTTTQQRKYIRGFHPDDTPDQKQNLKDSRAMTPPLEAQPKTSTGRSKAVSYKRSHLIPTDVHYVIRDKRLNTIYRELRSIDLSGHRNAVAVLFRVFVELSIELYLEKHVIPYNDNDKLAKKAAAAITHMKEKAWADARAVKGIQAGISSPHNPLSFNTFNAYVHNRHFHPEPQELATAWDNAQPCLDILFNHLT